MASADKTGVTNFSTPTDTTIRFTRVVDAAATLVYQLYVTPKHLQAWLLGPPGWTMPVCEFDARALKTGMRTGLDASFARLDALVAERR